MITTMKIEGMSCQHCVKAASEALQQVDAVKTVAIDLEAGTASLESDVALSEAALTLAIEDAGYEVISVQ